MIQKRTSSFLSQPSFTVKGGLTLDEGIYISQIVAQTGVILTVKTQLRNTVQKSQHNNHKIISFDRMKYDTNDLVICQWTCNNNSQCLNKSTNAQ